MLVCFSVCVLYFKIKYFLSEWRVKKRERERATVGNLFNHAFSKYLSTQCQAPHKMFRSKFNI